jgi:PPOX class probable F420-dependent enzyme
MLFLDLDDPRDADVDAKLRTEIAVWLTTVTPAGQPQSTPVWFHWDGETFLFYSQPDRPKLVNMVANPKVSLHLVGGFEAEDAVTFEGMAVFDPSAPPCDRLNGYMEKYAYLVERFGWTPSTMAADYSVAIRVTPTRVRVL